MWPAGLGHRISQRSGDGGQIEPQSEAHRGGGAGVVHVVGAGEGERAGHAFHGGEQGAVVVVGGIAGAQGEAGAPLGVQRHVLGPDRLIASGALALERPAEGRIGMPRSAQTGVRVRP